VATTYKRLIEQLNTIQLTPDTAPKVWPIAIAIELLTLASRVKVSQVAPDAEIPPLTELVGRFLITLFADRWRGWRHGVDDVDWIGPTDTSVAEELRQVFRVRPTADIAEITRLLFAYQHACSLRSRKQEGDRMPGIVWTFSLEGWLLFRDVAPGALTEGPPPEHVANLYQKYLKTESEGIDWARVSASWETLVRLQWTDHPGFKDLALLALHASGKSEGILPLPPRFADRWLQTLVRIRTGKPWRQTVSRLERSCTVQGCPRRNTQDPSNRTLAQIRPTICGGCGSVLVPDRLALAFQEAT
jgi:hypothetical protein